MSAVASRDGGKQDEYDDSDPTYTHFAHRNEFLSLLARFLAIDVSATPTAAEDKDEAALVTQLGNILDYYLPMPGLLDPALDDIVPPLMAVLSGQLERLAGDGPTPNAARLARVGRVVNWVIKVRGWKAVVPHFPSGLAHLHVLIPLLSPPPASSSSTDYAHHPVLSTDDAWELRAVLLLWLALLLTVPFSLSALGSKDTPTRLDVRSHDRLFAVPTSDLAVRVTLLALPLLHRPGREGEYAALVLARLLSREDAVQGLDGFLSWAGAELRDGEREREASFVASILSFLAVLPGMISPKHLPALSSFYADELIPHLAGGATAATSGLIRKLAVKARGRWWLARLGRGLRDAPGELPDGIEEVLDDLMTALSDKDTIVRYSAAKYLARIAALLPAELADEIVSATVALFAGTEDDPVRETAFGTIVDPGGSTASGGAMGLGGFEAARGEARWHGVCLAVAEMARRGLLNAEAVADVVPWVVKALTFDLRRGSHSVGSNVRDAGAYVLWSLSRASPPDQLASFTDLMATTLVCTSVFDREVGVRRAASAAFQEGVGRLGLYPEGIDVLGNTDFYSVSVRRKAFNNAAPAVAVHEIYRVALREHLHNITLRHWDGAMRVAGAQALAALLQLAPGDVPDSTQRELAQVPSLDPTSVHGALLALTKIAPFVDESKKNELIASLDKVRAAALITANAAEILVAGCQLAEAALTPTCNFAAVQRFFDNAERRREAEVHEALADAARRYSEVYDNASVRAFVQRSISHLATARASQRQANALLLGHVVYPSGVAATEPVDALLTLFDPASKTDVETRRNAARSLADIACQRVDNALIRACISPETTLTAVDAETNRRIITTMTAALDDYTTDQRGDVGSWVRGAAIRALARVLGGTATEADAHERVPQDLFAAAVAGIAKQAMEKLPILRIAATEAWGELLLANADKVWAWPLARCMSKPNTDTVTMLPPSAWFESGLELLRTPARAAILSGLVQTTGAAAHSSSDKPAVPLLQWLLALSAGDEMCGTVLNDLCALLSSNIGANRVAVPTLMTLARLVNSDVAACAAAPADDKVYLRALSLATRGVTSLKSIDRITAAARLIIASLNLPFPFVRATAADALPALLGHRFPRIRNTAAEALYLALSEGERADDIDPELEEALLETPWTEQVDEAVSPRVAELVKTHVE